MSTSFHGAENELISPYNTHVKCRILIRKGTICPFENYEQYEKLSCDESRTPTVYFFLFIFWEREKWPLQTSRLLPKYAEQFACAKLIQAEVRNVGIRNSSDLKSRKCSRAIDINIFQGIDFSILSFRTSGQKEEYRSYFKWERFNSPVVLCMDQLPYSKISQVYASILRVICQVSKNFLKNCWPYNLQFLT